MDHIIKKILIRSYKGFYSTIASLECDSLRGIIFFYGQKNKWPIIQWLLEKNNIAEEMEYKISESTTPIK